MSVTTFNISSHHLLILPGSNIPHLHSNLFQPAAATSTKKSLHRRPGHTRSRYIIMLWGKDKYILGALKLTKFASLGSMLLTVGAYTAFYGLPYATGMTSLILLIHESGHALTMKKLGIPFSPMVFIPLMVAAVAMRKRPKEASFSCYG